MITLQQLNTYEAKQAMESKLDEIECALESYYAKINTDELEVSTKIIFMNSISQLETEKKEIETTLRKLGQFDR